MSSQDQTFHRQGTNPEDLVENSAIDDSAGLPAKPRENDKFDAMLSYADTAIGNMNTIVEKITPEEVQDAPQAKDRKKTIHRLNKLIAPMVPLTCSITSLGITVAYIWSCSVGHARTDGERLAYLIPVLMALGEPVVAKAMAVVASTPGSCGIGWLSYSLSILVSAFSAGRDLHPKPEVECKLLNLESRQTCVNRSPLVSRLLVDLESKSTPATPGGLKIEVLEAGKPLGDDTAAFLSLAQCALAIAYKWFAGDASVLCLTVTLHFLAATLNSPPTWSPHKYAGCKDRGKNAVYALTRRNGHNRVFIIKNVHADAWDLEDLATGSPAHAVLERAVMLIVVASFLAVALLSTSLSNRAAVVMIAIMLLGTIGNLFTIAAPQCPAGHGMTLKHVEVFSSFITTLSVLQQLKKEYPSFGKLLMKAFFPDLANMYPGGLYSNGLLE